MIDILHDNLNLIKCPQDMSWQDSRLHPQFREAKRPHKLNKTHQVPTLLLNPPVLRDALAIHSIPTPVPCEAPEGKEAHQALLANLDYLATKACLVETDCQVHLDLQEGAPKVHQARPAPLDHLDQLVPLHTVLPVPAHRYVL